MTAGARHSSCESDASRHLNAGLVDIVIVNWNSGNLLRDCLISLARIDEPQIVGRVVVVDNGSTDGSGAPPWATAPFAMETLHNPANLGFARACNQGARGCSAKYILFLNPDTRLFADSLARPVRFMESREADAVAICGIRMVDERGAAGTSCARFPTARVLIGKMTGLSRIMPGWFPPHLMSPNELESSRMVDQVIGAFFLMRREVFEALSGFDERFFVYFEEVDLALRARQRGLGSYYLAEASAYHRGGGSSEQVRATRLFYSLRSRFLFTLKHYTAIESLLLICLTFAVELPARMLAALSRGSFRQLAETVSAFWQAGKSLPTLERGPGDVRR